MEKSTFVGSSEQCFLLAFRALAREVHGKRSEWRGFNETFANLRGGSMADYGRGLQAALGNIREHMYDYTSVLGARDHSQVRAYVIEFEMVPTLIRSGAIYPEQDFRGTPRQNSRI